VEHLSGEIKHNVQKPTCRDARLEYRIASVTVVQTAHVSDTDQPIAERTP